MSFWPGEKLRYAETHFKFRLPWSLLYRPWPEIIFDMPFQAVPGTEPALWIVVRDADRFPTLIEKVEVEIKGNSPDAETLPAKTIDLQIRATEQIGFYPVKLGTLPAGKYEIRCKATARRIDSATGSITDKVKTFDRWNLPGLKPAPLKLHVLAETPPKAPGYAAGEMHCHTQYSRDHVEFGATPAVLQQAAASVGLDFACCTDHAYDFAFTDEDYTKEARSPAPRFQALRDEIAALPQGEGHPLLLAGEEVSAGNSKGENVHVTVFAPESYLPGLGDCGRYWLENKPTRSIAQILQDTTAHCFAAHPFQQMGIVEKFVFRRGYWTAKDLHCDKPHSIRGLQFWNGVRDEGFKLGREFWIQELGKGNYLLPIGGNDAHGDLNDTTAVSTPLFSLKHSRDHVFGKVRTVVCLPRHAEGERNETSVSTRHQLDSLAPTGLRSDVEAQEMRSDVVASGLQGDKSTAITQEMLNEAFAGDNCYITDGPALWWEHANVHGVKSVVFHARNTKDFGEGFRYIRIFGRRYQSNGKLTKEEEVCKESLVATPASADIAVYTDNFAYLRAECESATGHFALTSAATFERG